MKHIPENVALPLQHAPLHQNALVLDYITSRYFSGFELKVKNEKVMLTSSDSTLVTILVKSKLVKEEEDDTAEISIDMLIPKRTQIKKSIRDLRWQYEQEAIDLMESLNAIHAFSDPEVKERLRDGNIHYNDLPVLFPRGTEIIATTVSGSLGGVVETCSEVSSFFGNCYNISLSVLLPTSKGCCLGRVFHKVYDFGMDIMPIDRLGIRPIRSDEKNTLTERGKLFREFTKEPTAVSYNGKMSIPGWMRERVMGADGRAMVDSVNFAQIEADTYYDMMHVFQIDEDATSGVIKDEDLWRCYNRVQGFSMRLKRWGWLDVDGLKPVQWRTDAFSQLVLSEDHKKTMLHLVKHYGNSFSDFIDGKSGGLVFLLSGPTGCGKTLSAEAVAEFLKRPLYTVSVGELGTTPEELETRLRGILDLAYHWNAVLLLDEADIIMEARDTNNIQRNAMVSIFLRLLEYYSGVMFLTTNRVLSFDTAFFSRISMAISYPRLGTVERKSVWENVTKSAGLDASRFDFDCLASFEVNGRNIKTAVRIAQTMALGNERPVVMDDLLNVLYLTEKFNEEVNI